MAPSSELPPQFQRPASLEEFQFFTVEHPESEKIKERFWRIANELPRLFTDLASEYILLERMGQTTLTVAEFKKIMEKLSLHPDCLLEYDDEYFEAEFDETVRIARQRGGHSR